MFLTVNALLVDQLVEPVLSISHSQAMSLLAHPVWVTLIYSLDHAYPHVHLERLSTTESVKPVLQDVLHAHTVQL